MEPDFGNEAQIVDCARRQAADAGIALVVGAVAEEQPLRPEVIGRMLGKVEAEAALRVPLLRTLAAVVDVEGIEEAVVVVADSAEGCKAAGSVVMSVKSVVAIPQSRQARHFVAVAAYCTPFC